MPEPITSSTAVSFGTSLIASPEPAFTTMLGVTVILITYILSSGHDDPGDEFGFEIETPICKAKSYSRKGYPRG